ncbi:MAG: helix-turn-helix domain-containing protein [Burkholderiaceae bacterium]|nr:helix-turn-helix domain-containing protein [Burkholderiaceae bacterium]
MSVNNLLLSQVDDMLSAWRQANLPKAPPIGWSSSIRRALGMTTVALADRLSMTPAGVRKLEMAESDRAITLASLDKLAQALGCEVRYALVPRKPLAEMMLDQAKHKVAEESASVWRTMELEDQSVAPDRRKHQIDIQAQELLAGSLRNLWRR